MVFVSVFTIQRAAVEILSARRPSSVTTKDRFRDAAVLLRQLFNFGMIAPGNHNFERFAALCNTPGGSQGEVAAADSMQRTQLFQKLRVAKLATPTERVRLSCYFLESKAAGGLATPTVRCKIVGCFNGGHFLGCAAEHTLSQTDAASGAIFFTTNLALAG